MKENTRSFSSLIKVFQIAAFLLLTQTAFAQSDKGLSGYGGLTVKSANIMRQYNPMIGGMGGLILNQRFAVGAYGHGLTGSIDFSGSDLEQPGASDLKLRFGYGGLFAEYFVINNQTIRLSTPVKIGYGAAGIYSEETDDRIEKSRLLVLEPEVHLDFRIGQHLALGINAGYRLGDVKDLYNITDRNMSGWTLGLGLKMIAR